MAWLILLNRVVTKYLVALRHLRAALQTLNFLIFADKVQFPVKNNASVRAMLSVLQVL